MRLPLMLPTATLALTEMGTARNNSALSPPDAPIACTGPQRYDNE